MKLDFGDLSFVAPVPSSFELKAVPGRQFRLRPYGLADQLWAQKTFGDKLQSVFKYVKFEELTRIVFHQLVPEDQQFFAKQTVKFVNEEGDTLEKSLGGVLMLQTLIVGPTEAYGVIGALMEAIGVSKPLMDEIEKEELEKKSQTELSQNPIGDMSSTSSEANTDGQPSK